MNEILKQDIDRLTQTLAANIEGKADAARITTEVRSFRVIVRILDELIAMAARTEAAEREVAALRLELQLRQSDSFHF